MKASRIKTFLQDILPTNRFRRIPKHYREEIRKCSPATMESLEPRVLLSGDIAVTIDSLATSDATPDLTGTIDDADAAITVRVDGVNYEATNNGDGTWSLDGDDAFETPLANGTYDVVVFATNSNEGTFGVDDTDDELVVDTDAPIVTVDDLLTRLLQPGLTGTINDPDATIVVTVDGISYSAANNGDGTWSLAANIIATLAEGTYDVSVAATDADGDVGTDSTTNELEIDRTAPVVTVDTLTTSEASPELTGTVDDTDATVTVTVNGTSYTATNNEDGTWTLDADTISDLANGLYDVSVSAVDEAGNTGTDATENELTIKLAPVVTVDTLSSSDTTPELTGSVSDPNATIVVTVNGTDYSATNNGNGTWTLADDTIAALTEGVYDVTVSATSTGGQVGTDTTINELDIDVTAPTVTVNTKTTTDTTPDLSGTVSEADAVVEVTVYGSTYTATNNGDGTWSLSGSLISEMPPGTYDISVTATDPAENEGTDATTNELTIKPKVTVNSLTTSNTSPVLTGTVNSPDATISVTLDGGATNYTATNNGDGTWTLDLSGEGVVLAEGTYDVEVTVTLGAETATDSSFDELKVDLTAPVVTVDDQDATTDTRPELTGTVSEATATVTVKIGGKTYTATNNGNGTWTLADNTVSTLAAGTYTITATVTDTAGNESSATNTIEIVELPTITVDTLYTSDTTPELTGSVSDPDATITITVNGVDYSATNNGDGSWTLADDTIATLSQGTYNVIATATVGPDLYSTDSTSGELVVDNVAPTVTIDESSTSDTTPTITGTISDTEATIEVSLNGKTYAATNNGDGTWTLNGSLLTALTPGVYDIAVTATDQAENEGSDTTTDELSILPTVTVDSLTTSETSPELTGTVNSTTATIDVTVNGSTYTATNNGDGTWTLNLADESVTLPEGIYDVDVTATVGALTNTDETVNELRIDATAPQVTVTAPDPTTNTSPEISGTIGDATATVTVTIANQTYTATNNGDGTWTLAEGTIAALEEGTYTVTVTAEDAAENESSVQTTLEIVTPPTVTVDPLTTSDTTPEITGTVSDPGATVVVTVNGVDYTATNNGDGTWTVADDTIPALSDGTYEVTATVTISAEIESTDNTSDELVIDTSAPTTKVDELETDDRTPTLTGTVSEATAEVVVTVNGEDYEATNNGDGTWTLNGSKLPTLLPGVYDVTVTVTDEAGNEGTDTTTDELSILPVVTVDALTTNDTSPELTGTTTSPTATITVTVAGVDYTAVNNGDGTWTLAAGTLPALSDGSYDVAVVATIDGLEGTDETFNELKIDTVAPGASVDTMDPTDEPSPEITGSVSDPNATVRVGINDVFYTATNNGDGSWTLAAGTINDLEPGNYTITVRATDKAGNTGTATGTIDIETGPTVTVDSLTTNETSPELTGTVDDIDATVVVTVDGVDYTAVVSRDEDTNEIIWTIEEGTIAALGQGTYDVKVVATNQAGYTGEDETVDELEIDLTGPHSVTIDEMPATNQTSPALSGTVSETDATITVTVNGKDYEATNNGDGTWSLAANTIESLPEGTYDVVVTAKDAVGNETTDTTTDELIILTTAPEITVNPLDTTYTQPELTGTVSDPNVTVYVYINGTSYEAVNNGDGTWTLAEETISSLSTGTYDVTAYAQDEYGNYGVDPTSGELTVMSQTTVNMIIGGIRRVVYYDSDGTRVVVSLSGSYYIRGYVTLSFDSNSAISIRYNSKRTVAYLISDAGAEISSIYVSSDTRALVFATRGGTTKGATIGDISGSGHLITLKGAWITLDGDIKMSSSGIRRIYLRNIVNSDITMYDTLSGKQMVFRVYNDIENCNIVITNQSVASFVAGSMISSSLLVGVMGPVDNNGDGVYDLPDVSDLRSDFTIRTLKIIGYRGAGNDLFANSNIAADEIRTAYIKYAQLSNQPDTDGDDEPNAEHENFGLTANTLRRLVLRQTDGTYKWVNDAWRKIFDTEDFQVLV